MLDRILVVDWSARATPSPRTPSPDAIWTAEAGHPTLYHRTRSEAMDAIAATIRDALDRGQRLLVGLDFPFGYPAGFANRLTGQADALAVWRWLALHVEDAPDNANNRFQVAAKVNRMFPGTGPFWGCPPAHAGPDLTATKPGPEHGLPDRRHVETLVRSAQPCWKLYTTGSVGSQALLGIARLEQLRRDFGPDIAVWPFQPADSAAIVLAEVYPSLLSDAVRAEETRTGDPIRDRVQVAVLARALARMAQSGTLADAIGAAQCPHLPEEGWILGAGAEPALRAAAMP
ncbi:MAG: molybdopterin guanine dinucleotide synthesis [Paracoccaceae bacterium]